MGPADTAGPEFKQSHWSYLAVGLLFVLLLQLTFPSAALAMETDRATASPNDSSLKLVIGGEPTRITWVGNVGPNEEIASLRLVLPVGCVLTDRSYVKVQEMVLDNPDKPERFEPLYTAGLTNQELVLEFETPIRANNQVYVEIYYICLPLGAGNYYITGSYSTTTGGRGELAAQQFPIEVVETNLTETLVNWINEQEWVQAWNSVRFLKTFFHPGWIIASIPVLFVGWLRSLLLVLVGFPLAIPIGLGISFMRMSRFTILRFVSSIWVNVIRGTPLFLQIYIAFFGMPLLGLKLDDYPLAMLVLAMNSSAYLAEIFRAGIQSINKGQFEAANSLGMTGWQTMFFVIIPQTIRRVIPTMTSEFILLYKDTSLLAAVGVLEQMNYAKTLVNTAGTLTPYIVSAGYYLIVTLPLTRVISVFEKKLAAADGRTSPPEDLKKKRVGLFKTSKPNVELEPTDCLEASGESSISVEHAQVKT
jgi:polar amino acid transport system substrate-binding protein